MRKIIVMVQHRILAERVLKVLARAQQKDFMTIEAVVSEPSYYTKVLELCSKPPVWINNSKRNEDEILRTIKMYKIDTAISLQHRWIISKKIIDAVRGYAFNIHFGKLPDYRGHLTLTHAILNNEKFFSITLQWILPEVDLGLNAYVETIPVKPDDTSWSLYQKCLTGALKMFRKFINNLCYEKKIPRIPLKGKGHFYSIKSIEGLKEISSIDNFDEVDKKTRAFYHPPHEPAYFVLNGKKFYVIPKASYCHHGVR